MKRTLSLLLSVIMAASTFACFTTTASAATQNVNITINGTEYNALVDDVISSINKARKTNGYGEVTIDKKLTTVANKRAKETMLYRDYQNLAVLPNGGTIKSYISDYSSNYYMLISDYGYKVPSKDDIELGISNLKYSSCQYAQSVGVGVFYTKDYYGNTKYSVYAIASSYPATEKQTDFSNKNVSAKISTSTKNFSTQYSAKKTDSDHARVNFATVIKTKDGIISTLDATSQFTVTSSNSKVAKIKGSWLYIKGNGSYKIYAQSKNTKGYKVTLLSDKISGIGTQKLTVKAKSTKKKTAKISWNYLYNDVTGYEIQYSTSKKFSKKATKTVVVKGKKNTSKTIKKLKSKKTYYVRVRCYIDQTNNEKMTTPWSKTKTVKVK